MEEQASRITGHPEPASFLEVLNNRLYDAKQVLYGVSERLNERGFYGPPSDTAKSAAATAPVENNLRHELDDVVGRIAGIANLIKEQVDRLA